MSIGHRPETEPHRPDMKKDASEVTNAERQEAKRRIEGSLAADGPEDNSHGPLNHALHMGIQRE